jgi:hypothetical protein
MNKELIERLAEQSGLGYVAHNGGLEPSTREGHDARDLFERFAALVAEQCVVIFDPRPCSGTDLGNWRARSDRVRAAFPMPKDRP